MVGQAVVVGLGGAIAADFGVALALCRRRGFTEAQHDRRHTRAPEDGAVLLR